MPRQARRGRGSQRRPLQGTRRRHLRGALHAFTGGGRVSLVQRRRPEPVPSSHSPVRQFSLTSVVPLLTALATQGGNCRRGFSHEKRLGSASDPGCTSEVEAEQRPDRAGDPSGEEAGSRPEFLRCRTRRSGRYSRMMMIITRWRCLLKYSSIYRLSPACVHASRRSEARLLLSYLSSMEDQHHGLALSSEVRSESWTARTPVEITPAQSP